MCDRADFTPNPQRAIWVEGKFDEALVKRLAPYIFDLTNQSRDPISVFIDSQGGSSEVGEAILMALRRTTPEDPRVSRIVTVAAGTASSAAANLLSAGDVAIASSHSKLLYHGARWYPEKNFDNEWAKRARTSLLYLHEDAAAKLAKSSVRRFLFIVSACRADFPQQRAQKGDPTLTDLQCFQDLLRGKLSPAGQQALDLAIPLCTRHNGLLFHFEKRLRKVRGRTVTKAYLQKLMRHASNTFEDEDSEGDPGWDGGFNRIIDSFYFLNGYFDFETLIEWVAGRSTPNTVNPDDLLEADYFLQFRVFFRALCRALQEGENFITPLDALWLGLVDTLWPDPTAP